MIRKFLALFLALVATSAYAQTTVTVGGNTGNTYTGVEDTRLLEGSPTNNFSGSGALEINKGDPGAWGNSLIRFTGLSNITPPVTVSAASIFIYCSDTDSAPTQAVAARRLLRSWVNADATWNVYAGANAWGTAGGMADATDRVATPVGTISAIGSAGSYKEIVLDAALVEGWINGTITNDGVHLERSDGSNDGVYMTFISTEGADTFRPYLSVTFTSGGGGGANLPAISNYLRRIKRR